MREDADASTFEEVEKKLTTRSIGLLASAMLVALLLAPAMAGAQLNAEVDQGRAVAMDVRSGDQSCASLSDENFERMGEYAMGRSIGNPASHEAMNRRMVSMVGIEGERRMHTALGHRYANCPGAPRYGWMGSVGGMMSHYSAGSNTAVGPGMMGGNRPGTRSTASLSSQFMNGDGTDMSAMMVVAIALGAALLGGLVAAGLMRSRHAST